MPIDFSEVRRFFKKNRDRLSPYFFLNEKTNLTVEFEKCRFMEHTVNRNGSNCFKSKTCHGCYSARLLSAFPKLGKRIIDLPERSDEQLERFVESLQLIKDHLELDRIRFYGLSDFSPSDIPYIVAASKFFTVDIISKTLTLPKNRQYLQALYNYRDSAAISRINAEKLVNRVFRQKGINI